MGHSHHTDAMPFPCWKLCYVFVVFLLWSTRMADAQGHCNIVAPYPETFYDNATAGLTLLTLKGGSLATWALNIQSPGAPASTTLMPYFRLEQEAGTATCYLNQLFDLEALREVLQGSATIEFKITCSQPNTPDTIFQWFVIVYAVNEFAPEFVDVPEGGFNISEAEGVGDTILKLEDYVKDEDVVPNHLGFDFTLLPYTENPALDGMQKLSLGDTLTGTVVVREALDYEAMPADAKYYILKLSMGDRDGKTSTGTIRLNIDDADDQPPEFWHENCTSPCFAYYTAAIRDNFQGAITWLKPAQIKARDQDSLGSAITYRIKQGNPDYYAEYVSLNPATGVPSIIKPVAETDTASFFLIVEAVENTPLQHSQQTSLWLKVVGRNSTDPTLPPVIIDGSAQTATSFRIATIVLGVLFGLVVIILIIFVICNTSSGIRTTPVLPRTIGKLPSQENLPEEEEGGVGGRSPNSTIGKSRKSVNLSKRTGGSRLDFLRSLKRPRHESPTLRSYNSNSLEHIPDRQQLPASGEMYFDQDGVDGAENASIYQPTHVSTISDADVAPYEDRLGLMHRGVGEQSTGMSNPVYEVGQDEDNPESGRHRKEPSPDYL